jgi:hypothetical protein
MSIAGVAFAPGMAIDTAWLGETRHAAPGYVVEGAFPRQNGSLFLEPPLYFATLPGMTVFATAASAILAGKYATPRLHRRARNDFLAVGHAPGRDTLFAGIERLPPGEALVVRPDGGMERQPLAAPGSADIPAPIEIAAVTEADLWRLLPEVVAVLDDPVADPFLIAVHKTALAAREAGAREFAIGVPSRFLGGRALESALRPVLRGELVRSEGTAASPTARRAAVERIVRAAGLQSAVAAVEAAPFAMPLASWIEKRGRQLGPLVAAQPAIREICLPGAVERLFARGDAEAAWRLLFYALWHRQHIERRTPETDVFSTLASRS